MQTTSTFSHLPVTVPASRAGAMVTGGALCALAALHIAWGRGSTFPYRSAAELTDNVIGSPRTPSSRACNAVAAGLVGAAVLVVLPDPGSIRRVVIRTIAAGFATRAVFGFAGRTDLLVPGSSSVAFRRKDRQMFSPICAAISAGMLTATR